MNRGGGDRAEAWFPDVSRETCERLEVYHDLLVRWQRVKNLVSRNTVDQIWQRHFRDSAQLMKFQMDTGNWLDIGSGAGFPGMVIAILCQQFYPDSTMQLVESDNRKCAFLREVSRETQAGATIHCARIEDIASELKAVDIVTARALATLTSLAEYSMPFLDQGAKALFLKGRDVDTELIALSKYSMLNIELAMSDTDPDSRVVIIQKRMLPEG